MWIRTRQITNKFNLAITTNFTSMSGLWSIALEQSALNQSSKWRHTKQLHISRLLNSAHQDISSLVSLCKVKTRDSRWRTASDVFTSADGNQQMGKERFWDIPLDLTTSELPHFQSGLGTSKWQQTPHKVQSTQHLKYTKPAPQDRLMNNTVDRETWEMPWAAS